MSGICSIHRNHNEDCDLCKASIRDLLPDCDAGLVTCVCGFRFFLTVRNCPLCWAERPLGEFNAAQARIGELRAKRVASALERKEK